MFLNKFVKIIVVLILISLSAGCNKMRKPYAPKGASFSIVTYNVNYGGYRTDLGVKAIQEANADIAVFRKPTSCGKKY